MKTITHYILLTSLVVVSRQTPMMPMTTMEPSEREPMTTMEPSEMEPMTTMESYDMSSSMEPSEMASTMEPSEMEPMTTMESYDMSSSMEPSEMASTMEPSEMASTMEPSEMASTMEPSSMSSNSPMTPSSKIETILTEILMKLEEEIENRPQAKKLGRPKRSSMRADMMTMRNKMLKEAVKAVMKNKELSLNKKEARKQVMKTMMDMAQRVPADMSGGNKFMDVVYMCKTPGDLMCDEMTKFRDISGICNNLQNPLWGASGISMRRLLPAEYQDFKEMPRGCSFTRSNPGRSRRTAHADRAALKELRRFDRSDSKLMQEMSRKSKGSCPTKPKPTLPNPRLVSSRIHTDLDEQDPNLTHMFTQFGQFLDHDITLTPEAHLSCCSDDAGNSECFPIKVLGNDSFYSNHSTTCLPFSRSIPYCEEDNKIREQMNDITAFIDASNVYGSDYDTMNMLRTFEGGKMRSDMYNNNELLPRIEDNYKAGDTRATEMPGLASMHTLFLREHNRIAQELSGLADDEMIFQTTRKILIAEMQNIVYKEYLPILLGKKSLSMSDPDPMTGQTMYDPNVDPSIINSFATAAYRFGHSMIRGLISMIDQNSNQVKNYRLRDHFFNMQNYLDQDGEGVERLLMGLMNQSSLANDRFVTCDVTNFLFKEKMENFGSDLVARNIQRGRDHGLPGYNDWREYCGLPRACSWEEPPTEINKTIWDKFATLYDHPNDIDLFSAGIAERPCNITGITGPVFNCILSKQFNALRMGDRFFYSHKDQAGSFTEDQLMNLQKRTLADIICDNTQLMYTKEMVFNLTSPMRNCEARNQLDTNLFMYY